MTITLKKYSDELGMFSSGLCMIHCLATPFLLAALPATSAMNAGVGGWWSWLDILFLAISFIAVFHTVRHTPMKWIQIGLIISFVALSIFIFNERFVGIEFPVDMVYFPAIALVVLHLVNLRQCRSETGYCENEVLH